jgi:chemotaxis protein MotA
MNKSTVIGIVLGILILVISIWATAKDVTLFLNGPGLLIVLGGTIAATLLSYPLDQIMRALKALRLLFHNEPFYTEENVDEITSVARVWYRGQIQQVESEIENIQSPFLKLGIQLVIDGTSVDEIYDILQWRVTRLKAQEKSEANVFRAMATYAPAFGMIGTLIGLINMLFDMRGGDFDQIGLNMAVALITTFYGIIFANLFFKPAAVKLEARTEQRVALLSLVMEGITLLSQRRSPSRVRETLLSFIRPHGDEVRQTRKTRENRKNRGLKLETSQ